jgi:hypothetical protein
MGETAANRPADRPFLICPRCGLSVRARTGWMRIEYCPRCIARSHMAVRLFSSPQPAELTGLGSVPQPNSLDVARKQVGPRP